MRRRPQEETGAESGSAWDTIRSLLGIEDVGETIRTGLRTWLIDFVQQNASLLVLVAFSIARATAVTVESGHTGLLFSFGRAKGTVSPGLKWLIPFLQIVRTAPTRQRTLDLPAQRVTTHDGLVYLVDANLVYRITDIEKALIEIDDLIKGMRQVLVLSVQRVIRSSERAVLRDREDMDRRLLEAMAEHLELWGVEVVNAGFTSVTPSPVTLRLVQLGARVETRRKGLEQLETVTSRPLALALLGTKQRTVRRTELQREREIHSRRARRVRRLFRDEVARSGLVLGSRARHDLLLQLRTEAGLAGVLRDSRLARRPARTAARKAAAR